MCFNGVTSYRPSSTRSFASSENKVQEPLAAGGNNNEAPEVKEESVKPPAYQRSGCATRQTALYKEFERRLQDQVKWLAEFGTTARFPASKSGKKLEENALPSSRPQAASSIDPMRISASQRAQAKHGTIVSLLMNMPDRGGVPAELAETSGRPDSFIPTRKFQNILGAKETPSAAGLKKYLKD